MTEKMWSDVFFLAVVIVTLFFAYMLNRASKNKVEPALAMAHGVTDFVEGIADDHNPNTTTLLERFTHYAAIAVDAAEQLYQAGNLPKEQRYRYAEQMVQNLFKLSHPGEAGSWDDWYTVIDGIIEAAVGRLPKNTVALISK